MMLVPIPADRVDEVWPVVGPLIHRSCMYSWGLENAENLRHRAKEGKGCVLMVADAETAIIIERDGDSLHVVSMAGRNVISRVGEFVGEAWKIAEHVGCSALTLRGRKGWKRILSSHGFKDAGDGVMEARK